MMRRELLKGAIGGLCCVLLAACSTRVAPMAPQPPSRAAPRSEPSMAPPIASPKGSFENLEDEMASLLGRPKTPS